MVRHFRSALVLVLFALGASGFGGNRNEAREAEAVAASEDSHGPEEGAEASHGAEEVTVDELEHRERPVADRQPAITDNHPDKLRRDLEDYFRKLGMSKREPGEYTPCGEDDVICQNQWYLERDPGP